MTKESAKSVFWSALVLAWVILIALWTVGINCVQHYWFPHAKWLNPFKSAMGVPSLMLSAYIATVVCRKMGISQDSTQIEILQRSHSQTVQCQEPVEMRIARSHFRAMALICVVISVSIFASVLVLPSVSHNRIYGYGLTVFLLAFALGYWYTWYRRVGIIAKIDAEGITVGGSIFSRRVSWCEVASCEITTLRDVSGQAAGSKYLVKDSRGKVVVNVATFFAPASEQEQFANTLRANFVSQV